MAREEDQAAFSFFLYDVSEKRTLLPHDKPGTNVHQIDDLSSNRCLFGQLQSTASDLAIVDSNDFECSRTPTVPVVNLVQIRVVKVSGVRQLSV